MRIGIDARHDQTGIGRYVARLVTELSAIDGSTEYVLFLRSGRFQSDLGLGRNFEKRLADISWYSVAEQTRLPALIRAAHVDLMHFPHFNVPIVYRGPFVVTVHDLTHDLRRSMVGSQRDPAKGRWKHAAYRLVLRNAVRRSRRVITVSHATKRELVDRLGVEPGRITVTYEGVDAGLLEPADAREASRFGLSQPFFLYVGSGHPHKNLLTLLDAFARFRERDADTRLVLAGDLQHYEVAVRARVSELRLDEAVVILGPVPDRELACLYRDALALVIVSLSEGFGLPGLEAMAAGTPVIASEIPALTEVYGKGALFVDPLDPAGIADAIQAVTESPSLREKLVQEGRAQLGRYSWRRMAEETREVYARAVAAD
jgi:glycosyltransferase involved in cell wall biosynthesis